MRALVVYESLFGNTQAVAKAVAAGIEEHLRAKVSEVSGAPERLDEGVVLLVVGGPTQAHGLSRLSTRRKAVEGIRGAPGPSSKWTGLREWLSALERPGTHVAAAAFDTRFNRPRWVVGSAAHGATGRLHRRGFRLISEPMSFFVAGTVGPLEDHEIERARAWGEHLAAVALEGVPVREAA